MKTTNKKRGFTIVELVIVIAVIAILAAVLIPTFSGTVKKAKDSAALQEATAAYKQTIGMTKYASIATGNATVDAYINVDGNWFSVEDGKLTALDAKPATLTTYEGNEPALVARTEDTPGTIGYFSAKAVLGADAPANVYVYAEYIKAAVANTALPGEPSNAKPAEFKLLGGDI